MKFLIQLAWKNLSRHRRRTLITASAIAFGLTFYIFFDSFLTGANIETERNLIWYETGAGRVMTEEYWEDEKLAPLKHAIEKPEAVSSLLDNEGIENTPRINFNGELIIHKDPFPENGSLRLRFAGIDPEQDGEVFKLEEAVTEGRFLENDGTEVLIGSWLAEDIGAKVGYPITIVTRTKQGFFQTIDAEIVGLVTTPDPVVNRSMAFLPISTVDYLLQMEGSVTDIILSANTPEDALSVSARAEELLAGQMTNLTVKSWRDLAQDYVQLTATKQGAGQVILLLVFIIAAVGITNTMLMAVYERIRELGMMRAMGMDDRQIRWSFLLEAGGIGFIGSVIGVILGIVVNIPLTSIGVDFSFMTRSLDVGYRIGSEMYGTWNIDTIITAFIAGIVISIVVAFIPTRKALKMEITDCLRHQ